MQTPQEINSELLDWIRKQMDYQSTEKDILDAESSTFELIRRIVFFLESKMPPSDLSTTFQKATELIFKV